MDVDEQLAPLRNDDGEIPNENLAQAIPILEEAIKTMLRTVEPPNAGELLMTLENFVVTTFQYHAAIMMDLSNEINEMWNFLKKASGGEESKVDPQKDLEEVIDAMTYARLRGFYNMLKAKGGSESGLVVAK